MIIIDRFGASVVALLLAYAFGCTGDLVIRRRSATLQQWNESFLAGLTVCAGLLFPLTLATPGHALSAIVTLLIGASIWRLRRTEWKASGIRFERDLGWIKRNKLAAVFLTLIIGNACVFALVNFRFPYVWDGYHIWATRAQFIYVNGGLTQDYVNPHSTERVLTYPYMVPMWEAALAKLRGTFDADEFKPIFLIFLISLFVSMYNAAKAYGSRTAALGTVAVLALIPACILGPNAGGYVDMPQAALLTAFLAAAIASRQDPARRFPAAILLCGITLVKSEGTLLFAVALVVIGTYWLVERRRVSIRSRLLENAAGLAPIAIAIIERYAYVVWTTAHDAVYGPIDRMHLIAGVARLGLVLSLASKYALNFHNWAVFWPVFLFAAAVVLIWGSTLIRLVTAGTVAALAAYTAIFLFTNWDVRVHIEQAYDRLLSHVAPAAALSMLGAFQIMHGASGTSRSVRDSSPEPESISPAANDEQRPE